MLSSLPRPRPPFAILASALILAGGCESASNGIGPENQLEVTNAIDQFQFQLTALDKVSDQRTFDWENTGTRATVDVSQAITSGSATLTIRGAGGAVVYDAEIGAAIDETTMPGIAGMWRIEVDLTNATGTFNFRVQKST